MFTKNVLFLFKGPALCVYNDAEFTDQDWDGIRMIYSSVKEEDKLKVGRFGLGFKSVFHITGKKTIQTISFRTPTMTRLTNDL